MAYQEDLMEKSFAYDLRVFYAIVIGRKMLRVQEATEKKDYQVWHDTLISMYPIVYARIDTNRAEVKEKYAALIKKLNTILNKYRDVYLRKEFDENGINEIESVLLELQHFIFRLMHIFDHFGKGDTFLKGLSH